MEGHSVLGDTIPEEVEDTQGEDEEDVLRIEPQMRRKSLAARVLRR